MAKRNENSCARYAPLYQSRDRMKAVAHSSLRRYSGGGLGGWGGGKVVNKCRVSVEAQLPCRTGRPLRENPPPRPSPGVPVEGVRGGAYAAF